MYDLRPGKRTGCYVLWLMTVAIVLSSMNVVALSPVQACGGLSAVPLVYSMDAQAGILHPYLASRCDTVNPTPSPTTIAGEPVIRADNANQIHPLAHLGLGFLTRVTWSPDGKTLAVGSGAGVWMYSMYSMDDLHTTPRLIGDYSGDVSSVAFSPDGKLLASASDSDTTVRLWNVATGKLLRTLNGPIKVNDIYSYIDSVAFSPNGKLLASGSADGTVRLWETTSGRLLQILGNDADNVTSVAFSPDGKTLAAGNYSSNTHLWDVASGKLLRTLPGDTDEVNSVAFSSDGKALVSASLDGKIQIWDVASGQLLHMLSDYEGGPQSVAFSPDGQTLASASNGDTAVRLWDARNWTLRQALSGYTDSIQQRSF